jgi:hypothetical protein
LRNIKKPLIQSGAFFTPHQKRITFYPASDAIASSYQALLHFLQAGVLLICSFSILFPFEGQPIN